ncbi:MAG: hypothetical protein K0R19_2527 [Bacillota bacterium]|nr:hypothetical protein [Bacillota bacterium]
MNKEIRIRDIIIIILALVAFTFVGLFQFVFQSELALIALTTLLILISIASGVKSMIKSRTWSWRTKLFIILYIAQFVLYAYTMVKGNDFLFYLLAASVPFISLMETIVLSRENS